MRRLGTEPGFGEKDRMRNQINAQIEEFLRRGGQITTCDSTAQVKDGKSFGEVWHGPVEFISVIED